MKHRYWIALAAAAGIGLSGCMHSGDESGNSGTMRRAEAPAGSTKPNSGDTTSTPGTAAPDTTTDPNCTRDTTGTGSNCPPDAQTRPDTSQSPPDTSTSPPQAPR